MQVGKITFNNLDKLNQWWKKERFPKIISIQLIQDTDKLVCFYEKIILVKP